MTRRRGLVLGGIFFLFVFLILLHPLHTQAATITVTHTNDTTSTGDGVSLREAVRSINQGSSINADVVPAGAAYGTDDTIAFNLTGSTPQTIPLASFPNSPLGLTANVPIDGPVTPALTVSGGGSVTVFSVNAGVTASITNLTIATGNTFNIGGGIINSGTVTVTKSTFSANTANSGGRIFNNADGTVRMMNCPSMRVRSLVR